MCQHVLDSTVCRKTGFWSQFELAQSNVRRSKDCGKRALPCYHRAVAYDFNNLETTAISLKDEGRISDALRIYLWMADGDPSLDGGYLGGRIAECYELLGEADAARYWYGRAADENPAVRLHEVAARRRLGEISISDLCGPQDDAGSE